MSVELDNNKDWTDQVVDAIDSAVGVVRDRAVVPITTIARAIVYGLLASILGFMAATVGAIMLVRFVDTYVDEPLGTHVWLADLIVGSLFVFVALTLWSRRSPSRQ